MKKVNFITYLAVLIATFFAGCHKDPPVEQEVDPVANFTFNKDTFEAGDVVHCTNTSTNAYTYKWTAPDSSIFTTQNLDYTLDSNSSWYITKTFKLEVTSKSGEKSNSISKSTTVKELILSSDYFSDNGDIYKPMSKSSFANGSNWEVKANYSVPSPPGMTFCDGAHLTVSFFGPNVPSSGVYSLQSTDPISQGEAKIKIYRVHGIECLPHNSISNSGQLNVSYTSNGKLHVVFNNIPTTGGALMSGDITAH